MNQRLGMVPQWARTLAALGDLLAESPRSQDRHQAAGLLAEAAETASRLDMAPLSAEVARSQVRLAQSVADRQTVRARG
jgi:hypothetical protein